MKALRIKGWDKHYENNRSRELKRPEWLPLPNTFDGRGFMELLDHAAGMSHYGAWCLLLGAASRMPTRGLLVSDSGHALSVKDISRMTRGSARAFEEALPRLIAIGWIEEVEIATPGKPTPSVAAGEDAAGRNPDDGDLFPHDAAEIPHPPAEKSPLKGKGNEKGNSNTPAAAAAVVAPPQAPIPKHDWIEWKRTRRIYVARSDEAGNQDEWRDLFRTAGPAVMTEAYNALIGDVPPDRGVGFVAIQRWIFTHYQEAPP